MALVTCSECGRAVSNRASVCIGCGAPLTLKSAFDMVPKRSDSPPPTPSQIRWRALMASLTLVLGVICTIAVDEAHGGSRVLVTLSALLIIAGLCWLVVTILQGVAARK